MLPGQYNISTNCLLITQYTIFAILNAHHLGLCILFLMVSLLVFTFGRDFFFQFLNAEVFNLGEKAYIISLLVQKEVFSVRDKE